MDPTIGHVAQGTIIKIGGLPFELLGETRVRGTPGNIKAAGLRHEDLIASYANAAKKHKKHKHRAIGG